MKLLMDLLNPNATSVAEKAFKTAFRKELIDLIGKTGYDILSKGIVIGIAIIAICIEIYLIYMLIKLSNKAIKYFIRYGVDYYTEKTKNEAKPRP